MYENEPPPLRALTLWPEWAWAIDLPDPLAKRVENRSWPLPLGEWFMLHAGKHIGGRPGKPAMEAGLEAVAFMAASAGLANCESNWDPEDDDQPWIRVGGFGTHGSQGSDFAWGPVTIRPIVTSAILGMFRVNRVLLPGEADESDGVRGWKVPESYGNVFEYRRLNQPIPCKGAQGLWRVPGRESMEIANVGFRFDQKEKADV